jgi:cytochrome c biogenesis protein CcmG/thiol:disulfide interchange protein DsbE
MNRYVLPIVAFGLLVVALVIGLSLDPRKLPSPFIGKPAPAFDLPALHDLTQRVNNASFAGQPVLVNFWATWCVGCRQEHDFLLRLTESGAITIYGVNWRDNRQEALRWLEQLGDPYVASGYDGGNHTGIEWGVYGAPETFLIGADGTVLYKHLGPLNERAWQRDFIPLLQGGDST